MPFRDHRAGSSASKRKRKFKQRSRDQKLKRRMLLENLEVRNLLTGPQVIGIQPNDGELFRLDDPNALGDHDIRNVAPQDITFHFDEAQRIDLRTVHEGLQDGITDGIQITRAHLDGGFAEAKVETDFGTGFDPADPEHPDAVNLVFKAVRLGEAQNGITLEFSTRDQGGAGNPTVSVDGSTINISLNTNEGNNTTARHLADAIDQSVEASSLINVEIEGDPGADITSDSVNHTPQVLQGANDIVVSAGFVGYGDSQNEVVFRFAERLPDDLYRINIFSQGNNALLNENGEAFVNLEDDGEQSVTPFQLDFELDLGAFVKAIVPQPVVRTLATDAEENDTLVQARDQIIVYFNDDDLCTRTSPDGPCAGTDEPAQQAEFYQLIYTNDSVNNLDDAKFIPETVIYNPDTDSALLTFAAPFDELRQRLSVQANPHHNELLSQRHGLANGDLVRFESNDTLPGGLLSGIDYHVINRTAESFQVSLVENGTAVTLTSAGSGVHEVTTEVGAGTFRLRIGTNEFAPADFTSGSRPQEPLHTNVEVEPGSSFATATGVGFSFEVTASDSQGFSDGSTLSLTNDAAPAVIAEYTFDRDATRQSILDNPQTVNLTDLVTLYIPHDPVAGGADVADGQAFTLIGTGGEIEVSIDPRSGKVILAAQGGIGVTELQLNFNTNIDGNVVFRGGVALQLKLGWLMGFRLGRYTGTTGYVSEGLYDFRGPRYLYLSVNDFNNNHAENIVGVFNDSLTRPENILARLSWLQYVHFATTNVPMDFVKNTRKYFGPVDITKLHIQLTGPYGRVLSLNNMDYSIALEFRCLYKV